MEGRIKFSVIVPVYKAEQYLEECIDSILIQDYTTFELILVDDGSPDSCPAICDCYSQQDARVKVIHQENMKVGAARNRGLDYASGDYILFVDADDSISQGYFSALIRVIESADKSVDVIYNPPTNKRLYLLDKERYTEEDMRTEFFPHFIGRSDTNFPLVTYLWSLCIRRDLLSNFRFVEAYANEDKPFFLEVLLRSRNLIIMKGDFYKYRNNADSLSRAYSPQLIESYLNVNRDVWALFERYGLDDEPPLVAAYDNMLLTYFMYLFRKEGENPIFNPNNHLLKQYRDEFNINKILTWSKALNLAIKRNPKWLLLKLRMDNRVLKSYWKKAHKK